MSALSCDEQADRLAVAYDLDSEQVMVDRSTNTVSVPAAILEDLLDQRGAIAVVRVTLESLSQ